MRLNRSSRLRPEDFNLWYVIVVSKRISYTYDIRIDSYLFTIMLQLIQVLACNWSYIKQRPLSFS